MPNSQGPLDSPAVLSYKVPLLAPLYEFLKMSQDGERKKTEEN
jgi:hypothetical protein